jgi:hypothetical protein
MQRRTFLHATLGLSLSSLVFPEKLTAAPPERVLRFAVASDGHYGQPGVDSAANFGKLTEWMGAEKSGKGLDFVVINGDLFHDDPKFVQPVKAAFDTLPVPYYVTRGNHDHLTADQWRQTWGYGLNHSVTHGEYALLLVDTANEKGGYVCPDLRWMETELAKHSGKKGIFAFLHIAPAKWTPGAIDCPEALALLDKTPNLLATFHGHDHDQDGSRTSPGRKPHFWDGHFGGNWGTTYRGYRVVEVFADGSWRTYQFNPEREPVLNAFEGKRMG